MHGVHVLHIRWSRSKVQESTSKGYTPYLDTYTLCTLPCIPGRVNHPVLPPHLYSMPM
jgi:hypothetical protein